MSRFQSQLLFFAFMFFAFSSVEAAARKRPDAGSQKRPVVRHEVVPSRGNLVLHSPGVPGPARYEETGRFDNEGYRNYRYVITDKKALAEQVGEGIFPNTDVTKSPRYRELVREKKLEGNHWTYADGPNAELGFYKWATVNEDPGIKLFITSLMLERSGFIEEAIKGLYATAVHFPKTVSYTYYKTPWYVGPVALDRAEQLLRRHPSIKMELRGGHIRIENRYDMSTRNDVFHPTPGRLVSVARRVAPKPVDLSKMNVVKEVGGPKVVLKKYENGHWQLFVDGKPFPIRAITYSVTPVGASPDRGTWNVSRDWQLIDTNNNDIHDGFFESWVDTNRNNIQDPDEPVVGDAKLLKDLGINTLRAYHHVYNKELFRRLNEEYGFYFLVGDLLGGYAVGSGALWHEGTDYKNPAQREKMLDSVREMVEESKDEDYVLAWVLGNENTYGVANNSQQFPEHYFSLVNEAAELIKKMDPTRPVMLANGDLGHLNTIKEKCPALDIMGANAYRGEQGFGSHMFLDVQELLDIPVFITEFGASAYYDGYTQEKAEAYQALYFANSWEDLEAHMAGWGVGNVLGGVIFEFMDEWWKANSDLPEYVQKDRPEWYAERSHIYKNLQPDVQETVPQFGAPFLDGWSYEEWYGLVSQGDGRHSPFIRQLRPAYFALKEILNKK